MKFLLLQTFVWMASAFFLGAILGCIAKRLMGVGAERDAAIPAGSGEMAASGSGPAPATVTIRTASPAASSGIDTRVGTVLPAAPSGGLERSGSAYNYPVSAADLQRGAPDPVQPQIQKIELTPADSQAGYPITTVGIPRAAFGGAGPRADYPVTTIGIPPGYTPSMITQTVAPAAAPAIVRELAQPRPEPLRPELARAAASAASVVAPVVVAAPLVADAPVVGEEPPLAPAAPVVSSPAKTVTVDEQPFTPVAPSAAAASALAARALASPAAEAPATLVSDQATGPSDTAAPGDDLTRIRSIDETLQARLRAAGVTRLSDIARWSPDDVDRISQSLGLTSRIGSENWIEQAQILSSGAETDYSRRRQRGEIPSQISPANTAEPQRSTNVTSMAERATAMAAAAAAAASAAAAGTVQVTPLPARLTDAIRENAAAADPAADPAPRVPRPDLSNLRSVRSEALRGDVTATETMRAGGPARGAGSYDDLKRIRGIGVLIEKKLNSLGVSTYEQVANWTNADIERVSQILDFKGRVEREGWVEQARILASGGQTDFATRVDRGEI